MLQIVGFQDSGKTTLVQSIISALASEGLQVGVIKHHGHGSSLNFNDYGKDTWKHRQAGAMITGVEGSGFLQINATKDAEWSLSELLTLYKSFNLDVILIEGFKREPYPKVLLLRRNDDPTLVNQLEKVEAVITWGEVDKSSTKGIPFFYIEDKKKYINWILSYIKGAKDE